MKKCSRCQVEKPISDFRKNLRRKDGLQGACGECHNTYTRAHYYNNKAAYVEKAHQRTKKVKQFVRDLKEKNPCLDCKQYYPYYVMDFDHVKNKSFNVATLVNSGNIEKIKEEISKCELVCSNCHRKRTHARIV